MRASAPFRRAAEACAVETAARYRSTIFTASVLPAHIPPALSPTSNKWREVEGRAPTGPALPRDEDGLVGGGGAQLPICRMSDGPHVDRLLAAAVKPFECQKNGGALRP